MQPSILALPIALVLLLSSSGNVAYTGAGAGTGEFQLRLTVGEERGAAGLLDRSWGLTGAFSWEAGLAEQMVLGARSRWEDERHYPKDYKTKHGHALQLSLAVVLNPAKLEWTWTCEEREYPHAGYKSWHAEGLMLKLDSTPWTLTLAQRHKVFPEKSSADFTTTRAGLELVPPETTTRSGSASKIKLETKTKTHPHKPSKDWGELVWSLS